jgi:hypothetical protein
MRPFPADLMRMWAISTRVNKPENDDPSIIEPIEVAASVALNQFGIIVTRRGDQGLKPVVTYVRCTLASIVRSRLARSLFLYTSAPVVTFASGLALQ